MTLNEAARAEIAASMNAAGRAERRMLAERLAGRFGVSVSTVYKHARLGGASRRRAPAKPEYRGWVRVAVAWAHRAPKPVPMDLAIEGAVAAGELPPEAASMPLATARRVARELGLTARRKRSHRMGADYPMQAVQIDGSSSEHLVVAGERDGDHLLRLHKRPYPASGYKNKPLGADRLRVLLYSLWDMCSGYVISRYVVARGESALDAMDFLCWALGDARREDPRVVLHGVPDDLWSDQGPLWKSGAARDLLERLDVNVVAGEPYAKERMGGVERAHRTRWARFERPLFFRAGEAIALSDLNRRLAEYEIRENATRLSRTRVGGEPVSRTQAWVALTRARPADNRLREMPPSAIETMAREARRKIDVNGIVRWGGAEYECADWHDRWVVARRAMDGGGHLVLECEATGERRRAERWEPRRYGDVRSTPATPLDRLLADQGGEGSADLYAPSSTARVVAMPTGDDPAAPLDDPLDDRCRDMGEAMRLFAGYYPHPLRPDHRAMVEQLIEDAGLGRAAVIDLAQELTAAASAKEART